jgi:hypothetical protein
MDWEEATCLSAVFMPESFRVLGVCRKNPPDEKSPRKKISSLEEGGISGDQGFKVFPAKRLTYKTALFLLNGIFPAALL